MKWPGLIPVVSRILAFPFALVLGFIAVIYVMIEDGLDWWTHRKS